VLPLIRLPVLRLFYRQALVGRRRLDLLGKFTGKTGFRCAPALAWGRSIQVR